MTVQQANVKNVNAVLLRTKYAMQGPRFGDYTFYNGFGQGQYARHIVMGCMGAYAAASLLLGSPSYEALFIASAITSAAHALCALVDANEVTRVAEGIESGKTDWDNIEQKGFIAYLREDFRLAKEPLTRKVFKNELLSNPFKPLTKKLPALLPS